jgi:hypothetical protein
MADRSQKSNKEPKKPKKDKAKPASSAAPGEGLSISKVQAKSAKK